MIQFCSEILSQAAKEKTELPANYSVIAGAEATYSTERTQDIAAEYRFQYPGLMSIFETFRGITYRFDKDDLELHLLSISAGDIRVSPDAYEWCCDIEPYDFLSVLWHVGFLQAMAVGGLKAKRRAGSQYVSSHQIPSLVLSNISKFQIHPMFRSCLGLKEK